MAPPPAATAGRCHVHTRVSPEQDHRLFREYAEVPAGAKLPELAAYPRYSQDGPGWDEVFDLEHELHRRSFFCPGSPPEWFTHESVSPPSFDDPDMAREEEDFYVRRPEEIIAPNSLFIGTTPHRELALPWPTIINSDALIFID